VKAAHPDDHPVGAVYQSELRSRPACADTTDVKSFRFTRTLAAAAAFGSGLLVLAYGFRAIWHWTEYIDLGWDPHRASEWLRTGIVEISIAAFLVVLGVGFMSSRFNWFSWKRWTADQTVSV
jgi:hypothetical protein